MNEQQEFAKRIQELTELAEDQEMVIFEDQIFDIFPEAKNDEAKLNVLKEFLKEKRIGINEKIAFEELITEDEKNYLDIYLDELKEQTPLTKGEREAFLMQAMAGEEAAQGIIMQDTLKNVVEIAKLYAGQGVLLEDLIGEGNLALVGTVSMLDSCENANEAEGMLTGAIMDAMQDLIASTMDESEEAKKAINKINKISKAAKELSDTLNRDVTVAELAAEMNISQNQILKALKLTANKIEGIEIPDELK